MVVMMMMTRKRRRRRRRHTDRRKEAGRTRWDLELPLRLGARPTSPLNTRVLAGQTQVAGRGGERRG
eukprot:5618899-Pyramimonas_sp.AAC.1